MDVQLVTRYTQLHSLAFKLHCTPRLPITHVCRVANRLHECSTATGGLQDVKYPPHGDVQHLENSFMQPSAAPSPEPASLRQQQQLAVQPPSPGSEAAFTSMASSATESQWRSSYIRNLLPYRSVRAAENRLEADIPAVSHAIVLMVAVILYDRGWNNLMDRFDESVLGDICCIVFGLGLVLGVKLMGWQPKNYFNI